MIPLLFVKMILTLYAFTCRNSIVVPIINKIGLGIGLSIWGGTNNIVSFIIGQIGIFGIPKEHLSNVPLGVVGVLLGVSGLVVFSQVKPDLEKKGENQYDNLDSAMENIIASVGADKTKATDEDTKKRTEGVALAVLAGFLYGFQYVPMQIW